MTTNEMQSIPDLDLYEQDFYLWLENTAKLLKERRFEEVDLENLIEEIESLGRKEKRELIDHLTKIIENLLSLLYWNDAKANNVYQWRSDVIDRRQEFELIFDDSPSLNNFIIESFHESYQDARQLILIKSGLSEETISISPPFTLEQVLDFDYLP